MPLLVQVIFDARHDSQFFKFDQEGRHGLQFCAHLPWRNAQPFIEWTLSLSTLTHVICAPIPYFAMQRNTHRFPLSDILRLLLAFTRHLLIRVFRRLRFDPYFTGSKKAQVYRLRFCIDWSRLFVVAIVFGIPRQFVPLFRGGSDLLICLYSTRAKTEVLS